MSKDKNTLVIIEDEPLIQEILREDFEENFRIASFHDGLEALEKCCFYDEPGSIILDFSMPKLNGLQWLKKYSQIKLRNFVPVVVHTAYHEPTLWKEFYLNGASGIFAKPMNTDRLVDFIHHKIEVYQKIQNEIFEESKPLCTRNESMAKFLKKHQNSQISADREFIEKIWDNSELAMESFQELFLDLPKLS